MERENEIDREKERERERERERGRPLLLLPLKTTAAASLLFCRANKRTNCLHSTLYRLDRVARN
jgi:hypothetical protein